MKFEVSNLGQEVAAPRYKKEDKYPKKHPKGKQHVINFK